MHVGRHTTPIICKLFVVIQGTITQSTGMPTYERYRFITRRSSIIVVDVERVHFDGRHHLVDDHLSTHAGERCTINFVVSVQMRRLLYSSLTFRITIRRLHR
jgi:hypothetical protein